MAKILVVEDDERLKLSYDTLLKKEGHTVERATDGMKALEVVGIFQPDLILLDILMPNMDGIEFLRHYDILGKHPDTKVIVFSNMELPEQLEEAYRLGASRYTLKSSTSPKELAQLINSTLAEGNKMPNA